MPASSLKTCLITGAAGGVGRALVRAFREADYTVVATDVADEPTDLGAHRYIKADLKEFAADEACASGIVEELRDCIESNGLHVLVNNAAIQILGGTDSLDRADWRATLDVNLLSPFLLAQAFLSELEQASGCIVNISSIHAKLTKANFVAYATSKAALSGMTRAMAVDLGPRVSVNAVEPEAIETPMLRAGFGAS